MRAGVAPFGRGEPDHVTARARTARAGWSPSERVQTTTPLASTLGPASACGLNASWPPSESVVSFANVPPVPALRVVAWTRSFVPSKRCHVISALPRVVEVDGRLGRVEAGVGDRDRRREAAGGWAERRLDADVGAVGPRPCDECVPRVVDRDVRVGGALARIGDRRGRGPGPVRRASRVLDAEEWPVRARPDRDHVPRRVNGNVGLEPVLPGVRDVDRRTEMSVWPGPRTRKQAAPKPRQASSQRSATRETVTMSSRLDPLHQRADSNRNNRARLG